MLPPKALHALVDIKKELLSHESQPTSNAVLQPKGEEHRRSKGNVLRSRAKTTAFQRGCQRHEFWSPVH